MASGFVQRMRRLVLVLAIARLGRGGVVQEFDDAEVSPSGTPSFLLVHPTPCEGACAVLMDLWEMAAGPFPNMMRALPRGRCPGAASTPRLSTVCELAFPEGSSPTEPDVVVWTGERYERYAGRRSTEALAQLIAEAGRVGASRPPQRPAAATGGGGEDGPPLECLERFLRPRGMVWTSPDFLTPGGVEDVEVYEARETATSAGGLVAERGTIENPAVGLTLAFDVIRGVATREEVAAIRALVEAPDLAFDGDPDSVDGMASHEIFVDNDDIRAREASCAADGGTCGFRGPGGADGGAAKLDGTPEHFERRRAFRADLGKILDPILRDRITPYVNERYAAQCRGECAPCYSLVRRYLPGERRSHEPHHDAHSLVTVVARPGARIRLSLQRECTRSRGFEHAPRDDRSSTFEWGK